MSSKHDKLEFTPERIIQWLSELTAWNQLRKSEIEQLRARLDHQRDEQFKLRDAVRAAERCIVAQDGQINDLYEKDEETSETFDGLAEEIDTIAENMVDLDIAFEENRDGIEEMRLNAVKVDDELREIHEDYAILESRIDDLEVGE